MDLSEEEWKKRLTPEEYHILRKKGTDPAFSGEYYDHHEKGIYCCAGCGQPLFSSEAKYDSGSGWPSFFQPIEKDAIATESDRKLIYERIEIHCSRCGGHLGHVFEDGPPPTHLRYCTNSTSLKFQRSKRMTSPDES